MSLTEASVLAALKQLPDPVTGRPLDKAVISARVQGAHASAVIELGYPAASLVEDLRLRAILAVKALPGCENVSIELGAKVIAHAVGHGLKPLPEVKNIIAVASGKGGVGKSTTAVNLALALAAEGAQVGLLDADIYGPSLPTMLGLQQRPESLDGQKLEPLRAHGLQAMSIGFLVNPDDAMVWRGPMATQALDQLLHQTHWHELDYLIVDMPPGTGDIQLTLAQRVPVTGAVIVTTPQDIALTDARKGIRMFEKVSVPILGVVENMAIYHCPQCGHSEHIFGSGGAARISQDFGVDVLGSLPLTLAIREQTDAGQPTVVAAPQSEAARAYRDIALRLGAKVAQRAKDYSSKMPSIKVENN